MNSNKYIFKNRISQHLDILHWVMGLLRGRAWAAETGGWGHGWGHGWGWGGCCSAPFFLGGWQHARFLVSWSELSGCETYRWSLRLIHMLPNSWGTCNTRREGEVGGGGHLRNVTCCASLGKILKGPRRYSWRKQICIPLRTRKRRARVWLVWFPTWRVMSSECYRLSLWHRVLWGRHRVRRDTQTAVLSRWNHQTEDRRP